MAFSDTDATGGERALRERIAQLERELSSVRKRLRRVEELDRVYTDFVLAVSHELRTPLTLISGYAQKLLLRWTATDEERRRGMVEKINVSSHRLSRLIDDMLLITDVESGDLNVHIRSVALPEVIRAAVTELIDRYPDRTPSITLDGHEERVRADGFRLEQVLIYLLDNAVKHSPPEAPVGVSWRREDEQVVIAVTDQGTGIDPADMARLFTRFSRLQRTMGQSHGGVGVGLYIARHLSEAMGGRIWAESERGQGSTFRVALPADSA